MPSPALENPETYYTLQDLLAWDDGNRYELENGRAILMGSPGRRHGQVLRNLGKLIEAELLRSGRDYDFDNTSSTDVVLPQSGETEDKATVVYVPDLILLCDKSKLYKDRIYGAPEFIAEVLSDSTAKRDIGIKRQNYQKAGLKEYWILDYESKTIVKFDLSTSEGRIYDAEHTITLDALELEIKVEDLFS